MTRKQIVDWLFTTLKESAWAPLAVVCVYAIGLAFHIYDMFPSLDIPTHFMGGVAITYFYRSAIRNIQIHLGDIPFPIQVAFAFACTGMTVVLWEFYENFMDQFLGFHMVLGLEDTIKDMAMGVLGALVFSALYRRR